MDKTGVEELVLAARSGDRAAFGDLVVLYERRVIAMFLGLTPDPDLAEELAQETFVRAWVSLWSLLNPGGFGPWLFGIARNIFREWAKDRKKRRQIPEPPQREHSELVRRKDVLNQQIFHLVRKLPDPYGEVLTLRYFSGLSCEEIAGALDRPIGTVTKQLSRGHAMVASELKALRGFTTLLHFMLPKEAPDAG